MRLLRDTETSGGRRHDCGLRRADGWASCARDLRFDTAAAPPAAGKPVVTKDWLEQCHAQRRRLPEDSFALDQPAPSKRAAASAVPTTTNPPNRGKRRSGKRLRLIGDDDDDDDDEDYEPPSEEAESDDGGDDNDEETAAGGIGSAETNTLDAPHAHHRAVPPSLVPRSAAGARMDPTHGTNGAGSLDLPSFFDGVTVLLYGDFSADTRAVLERYVLAYGGNVESYMSDAVTHVVTEEAWDDHFDAALVENPALEFVRPAWIIDSHNKRRKLDISPYLIRPPFPPADAANT